MPNKIDRHKMKYKFNVVFLEPVMEFLGGLEEIHEKKYFIIFGNQDQSMIRNYLKNLAAKYGNFELYRIKHIYD